MSDRSDDAILMSASVDAMFYYRIVSARTHTTARSITRVEYSLQRSTARGTRDHPAAAALKIGCKNWCQIKLFSIKFLDHAQTVVRKYLAMFLQVNKDLPENEQAHPFFPQFHIQKLKDSWAYGQPRQARDCILQLLLDLVLCNLGQLSVAWSA
ncbi:unnamed protein product [Trichogramma brassicae]|uniref:Uncharacterized protein n=1 Tax=Trichogramma brassicae TaxID=86971 RepID=A0A6H5IBH6_9HYME|nr:unnamed protein product [Trichogramma brassicae]